MPAKERNQKEKFRKRKDRGALVKRVLLGASILVVCAAFSWMGLRWIHSVPLREVVITTTPEVTEEDVLSLAAVDTMALLFSVRPDEVAERIMQHPWAGEVTVGRIPNGTLKIAVAPRRPVARFVDRSGNPGAFVDAEGRVMPDTERIAFNVPLISGAPREMQVVTEVDHPMLSELLRALAGVSDRTDALLSEISLEGGSNTTVYLMPAAGQGTVRVTLGNTGFADKFDRLAAFWEQAVVPDRSKKIREIDLRFDSQIVVRNL